MKSPRQGLRQSNARLRFTRCCIPLLLGLASLTCACANEPASSPSKETIAAGKRLYEERCKTVAGEKIYRTVKDVEGIVLLKIRPHPTGANLNDRDWPGAAMAREAGDDGYIETFLGTEVSSLLKGQPILIRPPRQRGGVGRGLPTKDDPDTERPGYRYVDVQDEKTGQWWRYTLRAEEPWQTDKSYLKGYIKITLDRQPAPANRPRYGVSFEDHVIPEERAMGLASSTVKVLDLKSQEVLGEMTMYAWTPGVLFAGPKSANTAYPWGSAYHCGNLHQWSGFESRLFVDQVLQPLNTHRE